MKFPNVIDKSNFEIVYVKHKNRIRRKLLIFTSDAKNQCYEFNFYPTQEFFYHTCKNYENGMKAILRLDENGNECIKYEKKKHRCSSLQYDPIIHVEMRIVKKPDYEIFENIGTNSKRRMVIFDPNNRNQCYEYYLDSAKNKFFCCGCRRQKKSIFAEHFHENTDAEYIRLLNNEHVCKTRNYDPKKYSESNNFILSPNFEIQTKIKDGIERKTLIIFHANDRRMCYMYYFDTSKKFFYCNGCQRKGKNVSARIYQNNDGEDYVILSNIKHLCSPKKYISQQNEIIIRPPNMKFIESNEKFTSKIFIFDCNNNQLCYVFSKNSEKYSKSYYCLGCSNLTKIMKEVCIIVLCQNNEGSNEKDEYFVKMANDQKHICKPKKYQPEKYETKLLKPKEDYILFQKKDKKTNSVGLIIYDSNDESFCYNFYYCKSLKYFRCSACKNQKTCITAKIHQDPNGNEYILTNQKKHVCKPIKTSTIIKSDTVILEKSGLTIQPQKKNEIDESQIIRSPNFELQKNTKGVPERKLIIFYGDDNSLCYEYGYEYRCSNRFICKKCKVCATLHTDAEKNNEKYIILGPNQHSCEPVKYEPEKRKIIKSPQFMIFNQDNDSKLTKLVVFTSTTKEEFYEYSFFKSEKSFRCSGCYASKKIVSAKLVSDSNDEKCVELLKTDHICAPKKFVLEEFQPNIIPENGFKICCNKYGKENSKLILFDSEKNGFCFEYYLQKNNLFICNHCRRLKKRVTAKLYEKENGEKYIELSAEKHVCKSRKYEIEIYKEKKNYKEKKTIYGNFVVQHNISGDPNSRLTIFDENDKTFGYQFYLNENYFRCCGCKTKNKSTLVVKLKTDEEGKQYIECTKKTKHACSIRNLKEMNLIFYDFKFEENGNILITNDPNEKRKFYKFKYDDEIGGFCCIKCKEEKKKIITATVCNGNDGKELVLLNCKHYCIAFSH